MTGGLAQVGQEEDDDAEDRLRDEEGREVCQRLRKEEGGRPVEAEAVVLCEDGPTLEGGCRLGQRADRRKEEREEDGADAKEL